MQFKYKDSVTEMGSKNLASCGSRNLLMLELTDNVVVWREHAHVGELHRPAVAVVEEHLDHVGLVVVGVLLLLLHGRGEEVVVVGLAPEHAHARPGAEVLLALRGDLKYL